MIQGIYTQEKYLKTWGLERAEGICLKGPYFGEFTVCSVLFNQGTRLIYCCLVLRFLPSLSLLVVARSKKLDGSLHVVKVMGYCLFMTFNCTCAQRTLYDVT